MATPTSALVASAAAAICDGWGVFDAPVHPAVFQDGAIFRGILRYEVYIGPYGLFATAAAVSELVCFFRDPTCNKKIGSMKRGPTGKFFTTDVYALRSAIEADVRKMIRYRDQRGSY